MKILMSEVRSLKSNCYIQLFLRDVFQINKQRLSSFHFDKNKTKKEKNHCLETQWLKIKIQKYLVLTFQGIAG